MINLTWLLPKNLTKGERFADSFDRNFAKSKAFARLFGIEPEGENKIYGRELDKKDAILIMKKIGIGRVHGEIILAIGDFHCGFLEYYTFDKIRNGKTTYRLRWVDDGYPG